MSRITNELVADIKTRYGRVHKDKLAIQKDMVALRDDHGWSQRMIARETGVPQATVRYWLTAYDEQKEAGLSDVTRLTPQAQHRSSDIAVSRRVLSNATDEELERIIEKMPKARVQHLATAAGR